MAIPSTDLIKATFPTPYIKSPFMRPDMFDAALRTVQTGIDEGKIYNQEFQTAKHFIGGGCEHAQHIAADGARDRNARYGDGDPRWDIGYAFQMNQAAALSRRLKKLSPNDITPGIQGYINVLDQIDGVWKWLQSVKPIIVKGRKPNPNPKPVDTTNMGTCAICEKEWKLARNDKRTVVDHGYRISDGMGHYFGHRSGKCFGVGFQPYQLSNQANKEYKVVLQKELKKIEQLLKDLQASKHDTLMVMEYQKGISNPVPVEYPRGHKKYEDQRQTMISKAEQEIRWLNEAIPYQQVRIDTWRAEPLAD